MDRCTPLDDVICQAPRELVRQTRAALHAYGAAVEVPAILAREYDLAEERCRRNGSSASATSAPHRSRAGVGEDSR